MAFTLRRRVEDDAVNVIEMLKPLAEPCQIFVRVIHIMRIANENALCVVDLFFVVSQIEELGKVIRIERRQPMHEGLVHAENLWVMRFKDGAYHFEAS